MDVTIWNKKTRKWIEVNGVDYIAMNINEAWFKLDDQKYDTDTYEINFINRSD